MDENHTGQDGGTRLARLRDSGRLPPSRRRVEELEARVAELEEQVREARRHHHRTAELTDVVTALLVPLVRGDREEAEKVLRDYTDGLG